MKKLSSFLERHDIDRPFFFTMLALCIFGLIFAIQAIYSLIGWWILAPIFILAAFICKPLIKKKPVDKKWVAIAPEKGEIAPYLTNGKAYDVIRFRSYVDGGLIISEIYGGVFSIMADDGVLIEANEIESEHLHGRNWTLKQVKISKN